MTKTLARVAERIIATTTTPRMRRFARWSARYAVLATAATVALDLVSTADGVTIWFVPAALALAYLVLVGLPGVPLVALAWGAGADAVVPATIDDLVDRGAVGLLAALSYAGAATWIRHRLDPDDSSLRAASVVAAGALAAAAAAAVTTATFLVSTSAGDAADFGPLVRSTGLGAAAAGMTIAPWLLLLHRRHHRDPLGWGLAGRVETLAQCGLLLAATWVAVVPTPDRPQFYLVVVPIVWVAIRGGLVRVTVAIALAAASLTAFATVADTTSAGLVRVQMFMVVLAGTGMLLGATESDRRTALRAVEGAEGRQRASLDSLEQGIAVSDMAGRVELLNPAGSRILGYDAEQLSAQFRTGQWQTFREDGTVLPPDERPLHITMHTGQPVSDQVICWQRANGTLVTLRVATQPLLDDRGRVHAVVTAFADITGQRATERAEKRAKDALHWQANHDALTGLANRSMLLAELEAALADRRGRGRIGLLFLDLDRFKAVNDTRGHAAGDELLVGVAARLERAVRGGDLVSRFGGDEFVILARGLDDADAVERLAERIHGELAAPIMLTSGPAKASASIGIAVAADHSADELLHDADAALYLAKQHRRGSHHISAPDPTGDGCSNRPEHART